MSKEKIVFALAGLCLALCRVDLRAQDLSQPCPRPEAGGAVIEPQDLRSHDGVLKVELTIRNSGQRDGSTRYCYVDANGNESPTLRVNRGDLVILSLRNDLTNFGSGAAPANAAQHTHGESRANSDSCTSGLMTRESTNLHFHGLTIPAVCHQDDVLEDVDSGGRSAV